MNSRIAFDVSYMSLEKRTLLGIEETVRFWPFEVRKISPIRGDATRNDLVLIHNGQNIPRTTGGVRHATFMPLHVRGGIEINELGIGATRGASVEGLADGRLNRRDLGYHLQGHPHYELPPQTPVLKVRFSLPCRGAEQKHYTIAVVARPEGYEFEKVTGSDAEYMKEFNFYRLIDTRK